MLEPLIELMLDTGITVYELNQTLRERAVRIATNRVIKEIGRESKSRVAIMTGLPRSEVTRITNSPESTIRCKVDQHPARRVLAAWFDNQQFTDQNGEPAILPIFGKKRSFERLVEKYGSGIPVRAMLDELTQINAVERLTDQKVRAKARLPILTGLTTRSIAAVGERGKDLLDTLTHNVRKADTPLFEATALILDSDVNMVSLVRREIREQGTTFINGANSLLSRAQKKQSSKKSASSKPIRLGVTVFYFQDEINNREGGSKPLAPERRKNLRRKHEYTE